MAGKKNNTALVPITIVRSDGELKADHDSTKTTGQHSLASPEMQAEMELKWRLALADHLKHQLGFGDDDREYVLAKLPEGYAVQTFEALATPGGKAKSVAQPDGKDPKITKRHTIGVGHPYGPAAKFRSPAEFAVHLIWLCSGSENREDCPCDWCKKLTQDRESKKELAVAAGTGPPAVTGPLPPASSSSRTPQKAKPASAVRQAATPVPVPVPAPVPAPAPAQAPAPTTMLAPQHIATPNPGPAYSLVVFRQGEMVWFKHGAWRLGIIVSVEDQASYTIAQLNHASLNSPLVVKVTQEMRPFLTFTVPPTKTPELEGYDFEEINWPNLVMQTELKYPETFQQERQTLGLEASKMAARHVNLSYSTFNGELGTTAMGPGFYGGVFLGAEQIRVGDAVRMGGPDVMRVDSISVQTNLSAPATAVDPALVGAPPQQHQQTGLIFAGKIYQLTPWTGPPIADDNVFAMLVHEAAKIGPVFAEEVNYRNTRVREAGGQAVWWTLSPSAATPTTTTSGSSAAPNGGVVFRREEDVHGRFYATMRLVPILDMQAFNAAHNQGKTLDATAYLNARWTGGGRSAVGAGKYVGRRATRAAGVGDAVVQGVRFTDDSIREDHV